MNDLAEAKILLQMAMKYMNNSIESGKVRSRIKGFLKSLEEKNRPPKDHA